MTISKELRLVLEQGYSAGGEPELAQQLAKGLRIKGKLNELLKIVQDDLNEIWLSLILASSISTSEYKLFPNEPVTYAIHSLLTNEPMVLILQNPIALGVRDRDISRIFNEANSARKYLKNKLNAISVRLQYGGESEYFLISTSNTSNI